MKLLQFAHQTAARLFYLAILTSIASGLCNAALAGVISQHLVMGSTIDRNFLLGFTGLILLAVLLDFVAKHALNHLMHQVVTELRLSFIDQLLATPFPRLEAIGTPRLMSLLSEDVRSLGHVIWELPTLCIGLATIMGCLFYLAWLEPIILAATILLALPILAGYWLLQRRNARLWQTALVHRDRLFATYRDLTEGIKELKLHAQRRSEFYYSQLHPRLRQSEQTSIQYTQSYYWAQNVNQFTFFVLILGLFVMHHWTQTSLEVLGAYAIMILYLKNATMTLVSALPHWTEATATLRAVEDLGFTLRSPLPLEQPSQSKPVSAAFQVDLQNITYEYISPETETNFQLGPLVCHFQAGEIVFLTGGNGSGKTTFLKLLVGLYTPQSGHLLWNGKPVTAANAEAYRQNFAVLFAEPYLFTALLGLAWEDLDQRAELWLHRLQLDHKVRVKQGHLSTLTLSYGQRKRLALLTAYLEERPVYIFDEWAAGQDPEFREIFYRQLLPELKANGKLVLVISHDDHYFDVADRLIKFDTGRIEFDQKQVRQPACTAVAAFQP
ncbi:MAG: cyclic peptide export ABC transporter [Caldilineaceae bacterium]|nr:cyclic peptide export ABC transporter [Caldilineaceae bacterium]